MKNQVRETILSKGREIDDIESRTDAACEELEGELEAEKTKVQEAQEKVVNEILKLFIYPNFDVFYCSSVFSDVFI